MAKQQSEYSYQEAFDKVVDSKELISDDSSLLDLFGEAQSESNNSRDSSANTHTTRSGMKDDESAYDMDSDNDVDYEDNQPEQSDSDNDSSYTQANKQPSYTVDYEQLYTNTKRQLEAKDKLWATRMQELSAQYQELKQAHMAEMAQAPAKANKQDELPASFRELAEMNPDIADAIREYVDSRNSSIATTVEQQLASKVRPIQEHLAQNETERHASMIRAAHPDVGAIMESGQLVQWINNLSPAMRSGAIFVYQNGTAAEIISLLDEFKSSVQPKQPGVSVQGDVGNSKQQKVLNAVGVPSQRESMPISSSSNNTSGRRGKDAPDFYSEFDRLAKEYEEDRSRRKRI